MISRSSFWVSMTENNKRRVWVIGLEILAFVVFIAAMFLMSLTSIDKAGYAQFYGDKAEIVIALNVKKFCDMYIGMSGLKNCLVTAFAAMSGVNAFAYLYNKSMVDFYASMPEKDGMSCNSC